ncbi:TetR/AcrR family transcriptional regulator [Variovorax sp. 770b2]|uniref:TetR/AcrR family transcriptional regulator n=1 Tax=Variovorax sp. 770b2 TaxID=1566271 RepID=UPI000B837991|nr:TetR/AcrR family transcriptional regulator [Variovorax sp. 770b2]
MKTAPPLPLSKAAAPAPPPARRTQAERSSAMRERLLAAAIESLSQDGYAGSTLSSIVRRAGVSRGAQVHHYPSKQALMLDVVDDLLRRVYGELGRTMLSIADEDDRLDALVSMLWKGIYSTPVFSAYLELQVTAQRDPALARALGVMWRRTRALFDPAIAHYFAPRAGVEPQVLKTAFYQLTHLMTGLVAQGQDVDPGALVEQLALWKRQARALMRARKVQAPPPRPPHWGQGEDA